MHFDFQTMKPIIQQEFDAILDFCPTNLDSVRSLVPNGGDPYVRKLAIVETAAEKCPVRLFGHYPFAFEIDVGEPRHVTYVGIGNLCAAMSGVDFSPLYDFRALLNRNNLGNFNDYTDHLHRTLNHDKLLASGFRGVYEDCLALNETETDEEKKCWREMLMRCCRAVEKIGLRLRAMAAEQLKTETDEDIRYNLERIVRSVNTPWEAPETFFDAMNTILCTTLIISGLDGVEMNAYGAIDRLLFPYYQRDLEAGRITEEEAYFLLQCFLHKTDMHCHFNEVRKTYDNGVSVSVGGCDPEGKPVYNAMTDIVLRAYKENKLINPKLNARAGSYSPREYLDKLADLILAGNNNIIIENDDYIVPMFEKMGLQPEDARRYIGNGCQEVVCPNQLHSRAFVYINMPKVLLDTIRIASGKEYPTELEQVYRYGMFRADTFDNLKQSFMLNLRSYLRVLAEAFVPYEEKQPQINPEPLYSAFTDDCVSRGQDITTGGARYYHKTWSLVGFGTLCDSLLSLREAYESGETAELFDAVENDFRDHEILRRKVQASTYRFGHSKEGDEYAAALAGELAEISHGILNAMGIEWHTSLFTHDLYRSLGVRSGATPDGRHAGTPFSRQMNMASLPELTDAARSMTVLSDAEFHDVGVYDFALPFTISDKEVIRQALTDYIMTCLKLRIPVLQTNTADLAAMQEEREHKGTHPDLVVRVCGYSAYFGELSREMQDEIIGRLTA